MNATQAETDAINAALDDLENATTQAPHVATTCDERHRVAEGLRAVCDAVLRAIARVSVNEVTIVRAMNATTKALTVARQLAPDTMPEFISRQILQHRSGDVPSQSRRGNNLN